MKKTAGGVPILVRNALLIGVLLIASGSFSYAQTLYKYRGENGEWIFTDRKPGAEKQVENRDLLSSFVQPVFSVTHELLGSTVEFIAHNEFHSPVEVRLEFTELRSMEFPHPDEILRWVVDARSDLLLLDLDVRREVDVPYVEYKYEYMPGDPTSMHNTDYAYQAPFSAGRGFPITQAFPNAETHNSLEDVYAVDIAMPVGTDVLAAREGIVIEVASENYRGGTNLARDGEAANIVRILHDDGTFALYAHLNWNSIRVQPGDRVLVGQYIADSGNTGYSSGPHLHFSVQKNYGLAVQSLRIEFKGANTSRVIPITGDVLSAYP